MSGLTDRELTIFGKQFNYNIFDTKYLNAIFHNYVKEYNSKFQETISNTDAKKTLIKALSLGLIGYIRQYNDGRKVVYFENIQEETTNIIDIPKSRFLMLHPCFTDYIREVRHRENLTFNVCDKIIVGSNFCLTKHIDAIRRSITNYRKKLPKLKVFVSSTCYDLSPIREELKEIIKKQELDPILSDFSDADLEIITQENIRTHDMCVQAIEKSDCVIFILDKRYGSTYRGQRYNYIVNKIMSRCTELKNVSISLVELFRAFELGKKCIIFINQAISNERQVYKRQSNRENFAPTFVDKLDALFVIDAVTGYSEEINNWIFYYSKLSIIEIKDRLQQRILD